MTSINDNDEQLTLLLTEARCAERTMLTSLFSARLEALAAHIHRRQLTGPEAAELLLGEEQRLSTANAEVH